MRDCVLLKMIFSTPPHMYYSSVTTDDALQQGTCCDTGWHAAGANPVLWTQWLISHWCLGWYWLSLPLLSLTSSHKLDNEILERDRPLQVNNKYHIKLLVLHFGYIKVGGGDARTEDNIKNGSCDYHNASLLFNFFTEFTLMNGGYKEGWADSHFSEV